MNLPSKNRRVDTGVLTRTMNKLDTANFLQSLHSFRYGIYTYFVPGTVLGTGHKKVSEISSLSSSRTV